MSLRYVSHNQYDTVPMGSKYANRTQDLPQSARSMESAATNGSTPIWVFERDRDGAVTGYLAVHHRNAWQKMTEEFDDRDGSTRIRMMGETVSQPIAWAPQQKR